MPERVIELIAPPRRMFPLARHRTIKQLADVGSWRMAWERVEAARRDGWRIADVTVLWAGRPGLTAQRVDWLRDLFGAVPIVEEDARGGHGRTRIRMMRDGA